MLSKLPSSLLSLVFFLHTILSFEKKKFENLNISTNNIISVEAAKVIMWLTNL
jgi:hypothetical protein